MISSNRQPLVPLIECECQFIEIRIHPWRYLIHYIGYLHHIDGIKAQKRVTCKQFYKTLKNTITFKQLRNWLAYSLKNECWWCHASFFLHFISSMYIFIMKWNKEKSVVIWKAGNKSLESCFSQWFMHNLLVLG